MQKIGVLLINLGTPADPSVLSVRRYLREFLSDPRVIDLPLIPRLILVNCFIAPIRSFRASKAYKKIWTNNQSPLLINSQNLAKKLQQHTQDFFDIYLAMRYGAPNIKSVIAEIISKNYHKIIILPLYPQYASSSSGTAIAACLRALAEYNNLPSIKIINNFYQNPHYITAQASLIQDHLLNKNLDHIIFSYHSIPVRQDYLSSYSEQCFQTSKLLADKLGLNNAQYSVGFQSRLGALPWVGPRLETVLENLSLLGFKNIGIACPSFVSDCLETLEEIDIRLRATWQKLGGNKLVLAPCLNDDDLWVREISAILG